MNFSLIFTLTVLQLSIFILFFKSKFLKDFYLLFGIFIFTIFHFVPIFIFNNAELDILRLKEVSGIFLSGKDIYLPASYPDDFFSYPRFTPYFPFWIYFISFADFLANRLPLSYATIVKIPAVFANLGIAFLLLKKLKDKRLFVLYLLNPVPTLISSYQGHWDAVVLFFLILGLIVFLKNKQVMAGLIFSLATLIKPWPIIFIPLFLIRIKDNRKRFWFMFLFLLPLLSSISIYSLFVNTSFMQIIKSVFFYQSMTGWWGISLLVYILGKRLFPFWNLQIFLDISKWFLAGLLILFSFFRKISLVSLILLIILLVYVFTPGFSIHYLLWLVPLALFSGRFKHFFNYSILSSIFLLIVFVFIVFPSSAPFQISNYSIGIVINTLSIIVWGYCLYWLISERMR